MLRCCVWFCMVCSRRVWGASPFYQQAGLAQALREASPLGWGCPAFVVWREAMAVSTGLV